MNSVSINKIRAAHDKLTRHKQIDSILIELRFIPCIDGYYWAAGREDEGILSGGARSISQIELIDFVLKRDYAVLCCSIIQSPRQQFFCSLEFT